MATHVFGRYNGGVFRLTPDGELTPFLTSVGIDLPPTNYVTWSGPDLGDEHAPPTAGPGIPGRLFPGFIVLVDDTGARIVADGLGYTNECLVHPETGQLYVNETFARRLTRFDVSGSGNLVNKTTITEFGEGEYPDGLTDADDGVWITSIVSNRVIRVDRNGNREIIVEDSDLIISWTEWAYQADQLGRSHLDKRPGRSSRTYPAWLLADLKTVISAVYSEIPSPRSGRIRWASRHIIGTHRKVDVGNTGAAAPGHSRYGLFQSVPP